jgi:hypothetical protein
MSSHDVYKLKYDIFADNSSAIHQSLTLVTRTSTFLLGLLHTYSSV